MTAAELLVQAASLTASDIAAEVRTNLATELARIDAAISSGGDPTSIATAVRSALAVELARLDATISSRIAAGTAVSADVKYVNGVQIKGTGQAGDTWGPV